MYQHAHVIRRWVVLRLTVPILGHALENAGALEVHSVNGALVAHFMSGLTLTADGEPTNAVQAP